MSSWRRGGDRRNQRPQILLGACAPARKAGFPSRRWLRRSNSRSREHHEIWHRPPSRRPALARAAEGQARVALLAHPASVTPDLTHSLDALAACGDIKLTAAFGPQHGLRGDKQDNMVEVAGLQRSGSRHPGLQPLRRSAPPDRRDDGHVRRRPRRSAGSGLPHLHVHHDAALRAGSRGEARQSRLGARPPQPRRPPRRRPDAAPRLGKLRRRRAHADAPRPDARRTRPLVHQDTSSSTSTIASSRWKAGSPTPAPGFGWPLGERTWVNPSPNAPNLWMARAYAGTVMLEGTTLSEGRGTTRPLELFGAPDIDARARHRRNARARAALARRLHAARLLVRADVPQACRQALQRRADPHRRPARYDHHAFRPWRIQSLGLQSDPQPLSRLSALAADFKYEYTAGNLAIDVINGGPACANGSTIASATPADLDAITDARRKGLGYRTPSVFALLSLVM